MAGSANITPRRMHGGAAHTVTSAATGHRLRIVRERPDDVDRQVYLVTDDGLVLLGSVTRLGGDTHYALPADRVDGGWTAESFRAGALALDLHLQVTPITTYLLTPRPDHEAVALMIGATPEPRGA